MMKICKMPPLRLSRTISLARMMVLVAAFAVVAALGANWWRSRGPVPLDRSVYLHAVAEPIQMVEWMSFSDGGSMGLQFRDARQKTWEICLQDHRVWANDPRILEGNHNIIFNNFVPQSADARRVPIAGIEERALLGLLERWAAGAPAGPNSAADQGALLILKQLRRRN